MRPSSEVRLRRSGLAAIALAGVLMLTGVTVGGDYPLVAVVEVAGAYVGPSPYGASKRVALPVGLNNAPIVAPSTGYRPPAPVPTPEPPTPIPTIPAPYGGPK
jgi:hypothetical protein